MEFWLPIFFVGAMGLALLIYVILDGYDLGIGLLLPLASEAQKDIMIASIGPFWDANETWIVLGVGILLIAFPQAHGIVLTSLYLPVTLMLIGLVLRGIAFDFRVKANDKQKQLWNRIFFLGSLLAAVCQGWMLGAYITALETNWINTAFAFMTALTLPALYIMLGAAWLLIKTEGQLQELAHSWATRAYFPMGLALLLISIATPLVSEAIADKWFTLPNIIALSPIPLATGLIYFGLGWLLLKNKTRSTFPEWILFSGLILICLLAALGLAYSIFPDIIIGRLNIWDAAAAPESLLFIFWGTAATLPVIIAYTIFVYRIFQGKATELSYHD